MTELHVPDQDELEMQLSARRTIDERIDYVKGLLAPVAETAKMKTYYEREIQELQISRDSMREELRNLRVKLGDLSPGERTALDQRYDMLGKIKAARGKVPALRQKLNATLDEIEEALKE